MKTMFRFLAVLVTVFVVGVSTFATDIRIPESLAIGEGFPGEGVVVSASISVWVPKGQDPYNDYGYFSGIKGNEVPYNGGGLQSVAENVLRQLAEEFVPSAGAENRDYWLSLYIGKDFGVYTGKPVANQQIPGFPNTFKLRNGKIPEELLKVELTYQSYISYDVPGLKGALRVLWWYGEEVVREESENGVWDKTCTLYPANNPYFNPDVLYMHSRDIVPEIRQDGIEGEVTIYLSSDKSIWATYDILTGKKVASSEALVPLVLAYSLVQVDEGGRLAVQTVKSSAVRTGIKLRLSGPAGKSAVIEYADRLGGSWQELTAVPLTYGSAELVDVPPSGIRFYRARLGN